jgi:hypothetical protein
MISYPATLLTVFEDQNEGLCKARVLRNMASFRRICLPLFSFTRFIAWLIPWSWVGDSWVCSQVSRETSTYVESATLDAQTDEFLSVSNNDLEYLTPQEAEHGTALQASAYWGHTSLVEMLLQAGADINVLGGKFGCATEAAIAGERWAAIDRLLKLGADESALSLETTQDLENTRAEGKVSGRHKLINQT